MKISLTESEVNFIIHALICDEYKNEESEALIAKIQKQKLAAINASIKAKARDFGR